jgi:glycosyltransferase involved in cell wall biosynthesis
VRVPWERIGWTRALWCLWRESGSWKGRWVLVQYTALAWSRRGFPVGFLAVLWILKQRRTRVAVVFHDAEGYSGQRRIDRARRACQHAVMRTAYRWAARNILTVPLEQVPWLPRNAAKAVFIPVGANLPEVGGGVGACAAEPRTLKTVAVFGVTGNFLSSEVADIDFALRHSKSKVGELRLVVLGRGSTDAEPALRRELNGAGVEVEVLGLLSPEQVARVLSRADALLFVRGGVSSRRGSAIAGIACGLPVVGYRGEETGFPITQAGVLLVPKGDRAALAEALGRVLAEDWLRGELQKRSREAHRRYFSWDVISDSFLRLLVDEAR